MLISDEEYALSGSITHHYSVCQKVYVWYVFAFSLPFFVVVFTTTLGYTVYHFVVVFIAQAWWMYSPFFCDTAQLQC